MRRRGRVMRHEEICATRQQTRRDETEGAEPGADGRVSHAARDLEWSSTPQQPRAPGLLAPTILRASVACCGHRSRSHSLLLRGACCALSVSPPAA
jgi:hypothetical protein